MAKIDIIITDAGLAEIVNAENNGTAPVGLAAVGFGTGQYTPSASQTALTNEIKRIDAVSGGAVGDNILHLTAEDSSADAYTVYEIGIYTESGTLFAVYSQNSPIITKAAASQALLALDIALTNVNPESITVGDTNFVLNPATTEREGVIELATEAEAEAGTDTERAITPRTLHIGVEAHSNVVHRSGTEIITGVKIFNNPVKVGSANAMVRSVDNSDLRIAGGTSVNNGGAVFLFGTDNTSSMAGSFRIRAAKGDQMPSLDGKPDGTLTWDGKKITKEGDCLPFSGGTMTGAIQTSANQALVKTDTKGGIQICGGTNLENGGSILGYGKNYELNPEFKGALRLQATDGIKTYDTVLFPDGRMRLGNGAQLNFQDNEEQRIFIDTNGDLLVGDTNIGALLRVRGNKSEDNPGGFQFRAQDASNTKYLIGKPNGILTWGGNNVITSAGGTITGDISFNPASKSAQIYGCDSQMRLAIFGGNNSNVGGVLRLIGIDDDGNYSCSGGWRLTAADGTNIKGTMEGRSDGKVYINSKEAVAVIWWHNGASWYRKYADGFIEQGGIATVEGTTATVSLFTNFSDTKYKVNATCNTTATSGYDVNYTAMVMGMKTSSFVIKANYTANGVPFAWYACGY